MEGIEAKRKKLKEIPSPLELEKQIRELEFKLKTLQNFVFEHHHCVSHTDSSSDEIDHDETSEAKVWVQYPNCRKEEPLYKSQ